MDDLASIGARSGAELCDFETWRRERKKYVRMLMVQLITLSEDKLRSLSDVWEEQCRDIGDSDTANLEKLLVLSMHFYFFRNFDTFLTSYLQFLVLLQGDHHLVIRAIFDTIDYACEYTVDKAALFRGIWDDVTMWLGQGNPEEHWFTIIEMLPVTRKRVNEWYFEFMSEHWNDVFTVYAKSQGEFQAKALSVISQHFADLDGRSNGQFLKDVHDKCMEVMSNEDNLAMTSAALCVLVELLEVHTNIGLVDFERVRELVGGCRSETREALWRLVTFVDPNPPIQFEKVLERMLECRTDMLIPFIRRWKERLDGQYIVDYVWKVGKSGYKCYGCCIFEVLRVTLKEFKGLKANELDFDVLTPCDHFVDCVVENEYLMYDSHVEYFRNFLINETSLDERTISAIRILKSFKQRFPDHEEILCGMNSRVKFSSMSVRLAYIDALEMLDDVDKRNRMLIIVASCEPDKTVRLAAAERLTVTISLSYDDMLYQLLNDSCGKVRRCLLSMFHELHIINPLGVRMVWEMFMEHTVRVLMECSDTKGAKKAASILPICGAHFTKCDYCAKRYGNNTVLICLTLLASTQDAKSELCHGDCNGHGQNTMMSQPSVKSITAYLSTGSPTLELKTFTVGNNKVVDEPMDTACMLIGESLITPTFVKAEQKQVVSIHSSIHHLCCSESIAKRNLYLIQAFGALGKLCEPHLDAVLKCFAYQLETQTDEKFLTVAVRSLSAVASSVYNGLNIGRHYPELKQPLIRLISSAQSPELAVEIVKLFGNTFDSLIYTDQDPYSDFLEDVVGDQIYTDFILKTIVENFSDGTLKALKAIAMVVENDPERSAQFAGDIMPLFARALDKSSVVLRSQLFVYFGVVCKHIKTAVVPYFSICVPLINKLVDTEAGLRFCVGLAQQYGMEMDVLSGEIFRIIRFQLDIQTGKLFTYSVWFLCHSVVRQKQSLDSLFMAFEKLDLSDHWKAKKVVKGLTYLVQNCDITAFCSRISILISSLNIPVTDLVRSIMVCQHIPVNGMMCFFPDMDFTTDGAGIPANTEDPRTCITKVPLTATIERLSSGFTPLEEFFAAFHYPKETEIKQFLERLGREVVKYSPLATIRCCYECFCFRQQLIRKLFQVSFLVAWTSTTKEDRMRFSRVVDRIITEHSTVDPLIIQLIQLLERHLVPFDIDIVRVAKVCGVRPLSFLFLNRRYIDGDMSVLPDLMETALRLNKIDALRVYMDAYGQLSKEESAVYSGYMGDWGKALSIFKEIGAPVSTITGCLEKLKRYDDIMDMEGIYNSMEDSEEKIAATGPFLSAFLIYRENAKIERALESIPSDRMTLELYYFAIVYMISIKDYDKAQKYLDEAFLSLAEKQHEYCNGDCYLMNTRLAASHLFHECQFVLDLKGKMRNSPENVDGIWAHRIHFFTRNEASWEKLIVIRNLVLPVQNNLPSYIRVLSELRKSGYFQLINEYFEKHFDYFSNGEVVIERLKLTAAKGDRDLCIRDCRTRVLFLQAATRNEWLEIVSGGNEILFGFLSLYQFSKQPAFTSDAKDFLINYVDASSLDNVMTVLQTQGRDKHKKLFVEIIEHFPKEMFQCYSMVMRSGTYSFEYFYGITQLYAKLIMQTYPDRYGALKVASKYFRCALIYDPEAYRTWANWAFVNAKMHKLLRENPEAENDDATEELDWTFEDERRTGMGTQMPSEVVFDLSGLETDKMFDIEDLEALSEEEDAPIEDNPRRYSNRAGVRWEAGAQQRRRKWESVGRDTGDVNNYGVNAIIGYLKAIELRPSNALAHLCLMLSLLFSLGDATQVPDDVVAQIGGMPTSCVLQMIPHITTQVNHRDERIRDIVCGLLMDVSHIHFQKVYFPLNLCAHDGSEGAKEILLALISGNASVVADAELFFDGMVRSSCTWFESWKFALENASHSQASWTSILAAKFEEFDHPKCEMDLYFVNMYSAIVKEARLLFNERTDASIRAMWTRLRRMYDSITSKINKLGIILLTKVSKPLAEKRGMQVLMPDDGMASCLIEYVEPVMEVLGTQQRPRVTYFVAANGRRVKFLLKGSDDLRLDERLMQFFSLINSLMAASRENLDMPIAIYSILPLLKDAGIIRWVTGADALHELILEDRAMRHRPRNEEQIISREIHEKDFGLLNGIQRLEVFRHIADVCRGKELFEQIWLKSPNASVWTRRTEGFTASTAVMSMVGYTIGLGDRHPGNVMIQRDTGSVVHIDFGECFESTLLRDSFPEKVPFRLTRVIVNALEGASVDGVFSRLCEKVLRFLRRHRVTLAAQLEIFVHAPLNLAARKVYQSDKVIMDRVITKLDGNDGDDEATTVEDQVRRLTRIAADPANYVLHYPGWCPFW